MPDADLKKYESPYPRGDRKGILDVVRDSGKIHFVDTTTRDITQANSGNRFRLAEDALIGPYLDNCGFFSLENGGGAHFHVAMPPSPPGNWAFRPSSASSTPKSCAPWTARP